MPGSPQTEPLDDRLTDMGRALANSLLGDSSGRPVVARPVELPANRPAVVRRRNRPAAPSPYEGLPWLAEDSPPLEPSYEVARDVAPRPVQRPALRPRVEPTAAPFQTAPRPTPRPAPRPAPHPVATHPVAADRVTQELVVPEGPEAVEPPSRTARALRSFIEWALVLGTAAIVALLLQHFVVQFYEIPSESMYPTLKEQDRVAVNKLAYSIGGGVERGDVIVFKRPASERSDDPDQPGQLIKRVIGLPGDVVEARSGVVYIDGKPLSETGDSGYLDANVVTNNLPEPVTVPPGRLFVMGDNREHSRDSRFFGAIPESDIIGRAMAVAWPFNRFGTL